MGLRHSPWQALSSALKVPALFLLTLSICLPTLHFIGLLFGSRVAFSHTVVVLLTGITLSAILLVAFAPISLFFLASGSDYEFLLFLHVLTFAFCGAAGLHSVNKTFRYIRQKMSGQNGVSIHLLKIWMFLYMFVGTQTAYNLSPFIERETTFKWFNRAPGNFYTYLWSFAKLRFTGTCTVFFATRNKDLRQFPSPENRFCKTSVICGIPWLNWRSDWWVKPLSGLTV